MPAFWRAVKRAVLPAEGGDAAGARTFAGAEDLKAEGFDLAEEMGFEFQQARGDRFVTEAMEEIERGFETGDSRRIQHAGFVALRGGNEPDFVEGVEIGRDDIPRSEQGRAQALEVGPPDVDD